MSQGIVHGEKMACPLHNWNIELASGMVAAPDRGCTRAFSVRAVEGEIFLLE